MLTKQILQKNQNKMLRSGIIDDSKLLQQIGTKLPIKYVISVGAVGDWAIYIGKVNQTDKQIQMYGTKVINQEIIRAIANCTTDAFKLYRY